MREPIRQSSSQGIAPMVAAISRMSSRSAPCWPTMTTSSPGSTSTSVTSIIIMSMQTAPTIGTRRPRTRTTPRLPLRVSMPSA